MAGAIAADHEDREEATKSVRTIMVNDQPVEFEGQESMPDELLGEYIPT